MGSLPQLARRDGADAALIQTKHPSGFRRKLVPRRALRTADVKDPVLSGEGEHVADPSVLSQEEISAEIGSAGAEDIAREGEAGGEEGEE